jgi:hypothetical protein
MWWGSQINQKIAFFFCYSEFEFFVQCSHCSAPALRCCFLKKKYKYWFNNFSQTTELTKKLKKITTTRLESQLISEVHKELQHQYSSCSKLFILYLISRNVMWRLKRVERVCKGGEKNMWKVQGWYWFSLFSPLLLSVCSSPAKLKIQIIFLCILSSRRVRRLNNSLVINNVCKTWGD